MARSSRPRPCMHALEEIIDPYVYRNAMKRPQSRPRVTLDTIFSISTTHRRPTPTKHARSTTSTQNRSRTPTPLALTIPLLRLHPLPCFLNEPLSLSDIAHSSTQLALFTILDLLQLTSRLNVLFSLSNEASEADFDVLAKVLAFVEDGIVIADRFDIFDAAGEVECGATVGGVVGELFSALGNDTLDFFFVRRLVDVDVDV